jgi:hypothetical protein
MSHGLQRSLVTFAQDNGVDGKNGMTRIVSYNANLLQSIAFQLSRRMRLSFSAGF